MWEEEGSVCGRRGVCVRGGGYENISKIPHGFKAAVINQDSM